MDEKRTDTEQSSELLGSEGSRAEEVSAGDSQSTQEISSYADTRKEENLKVESQRSSITEDDKQKQISAYVSMALEEDIIAFNGIELKKKYPKTYKELAEYIAEKAKFPAEEVDEEMPLGILLYSPRSVLFNFFDSKKIFLNVHGSDAYWKWSIDPNESSNPFKNRSFAEYEGFIQAFTRYEYA
jgi:hypothetical protein